MELFIHYSAIEATCNSTAVMAATLALGGLCPLTGEKVPCVICLLFFSKKYQDGYIRHIETYVAEKHDLLRFLTSASFNC